MHLDIWIFATKYTMKYKYIERETSKKGERRVREEGGEREYQYCIPYT